LRRAVEKIREDFGYTEQRMGEGTGVRDLIRNKKRRVEADKKAQGTVLLHGVTSDKPKRIKIQDKKWEEPEKFWGMRKRTAARYKRKGGHPSSNDGT